MFPGKRGRTLAAAVFAVVCAIVATCSVIPTALAQSAPVSYGPTAFTQNGAMPQIPLTGTGFDKCSVTLSAVSGQILVQPYAMQNAAWVRVINQGGIAFAGTYPGPVSSTTYTAFYVGVTVNSGGVTVSETCWSSTAPTPTPSSAGQNVSIVNPLDSTGAVRVGGTFTGTVTIGVPTVIPSCPAAAYPCGLPTPIPTGSPYPAPIPTPSGGLYPVFCASYPCGFPTPIPTGSPYPGPTTSPAATFSPYPGGAVVLTGPSTAPAASAGTYAVCVDSSGRLCVQTPAPTFTGNQTVSGTVTANQGTSPWVISGTVTSTTPSPCATAAAGVCKVDIASQSLTPIAVTTPSADVLPTATAGATPQAQYPFSQSVAECYHTSSIAPFRITSGNVTPLDCTAGGAVLVVRSAPRFNTTIAATGTTNLYALNGETFCGFTFVSGASGPSGTGHFIEQNSDLTKSMVVGKEVTISANATTYDTETLQADTNTALTVNSPIGANVAWVQDTYSAGTGSITAAFYCAAIAPTPIPYTSASPLPVAASIPPVTQGTSPWVISGTVTSTTPSPCATAASGVCKVDIASQSLSPVVVSTPSAGPAPTASAGAALPSAAVQTLAQILCAYTTGTVSITAGNTYTARCDSLGNLQVTFPSAQPVTIANASAMPVTTPAPCATPTCNSVVWQGTSPWVVTSPAPCATAASGVCKVDISSQSLSPIVTAPQATIPAVLPTQSAGPVVTALPVQNYPVVVDKTDGKYYPQAGCGGNTAGTNTGCSMNIAICAGGGTPCVGQTAAPADATTNATVMDPFQSFPMVFNGTTWDRQRKCTSTASGQTTSATTTALVAASGTTKVYICGYSFAFASGTAAGVKIIYGTKVTTECDTGAVTMLNTTLLPATGALSLFDSFTMMETPASQEVCVVTTGSSTPTENWTIWYTQQ